jgi:copper resistance protein C
MTRSPAPGRLPHPRLTGRTRRIAATSAGASTTVVLLVHLVRLALVVIGLVAVIVAGGAARAGAHEGEGQFTVSLVDPPAPRAPGSVRYQVLLTYVNDGHPAPDATVTAVAEGPTTVGPLPMAEAAEGTYEATVAFPSPGAWTVRFTAVTPAAVLEVTQDLPAAATTTVASTVPPPTSTPPSALPATSPSTAPGSTIGDPGEAAGDKDDDGGGGVWPVVLLALGAGAVVAVGAAVLVRRRRQPA